jgi:FkbM family methyltransferase
VGQSLFSLSLGAFERLGRMAQRRRRRLRLRGTLGADLESVHLDSLEMLEWARACAAPAISSVYDLGANVGTWTTLARAIFPGAQIQAFEPLPGHADEFARRTQGWPGVVLHRVALGSAAGEAEMDVTSYSDSASLLPLARAGREYFGLTPGARIRVPVVRLDDWCAEHRLPPPDLLKLDLQGYELEALRGAVSLLPHVRYILAEVSFAEFYAGQPLFTEMSGFLAAQGFHLAALGHNAMAAAPLIQADALFTRSRSTL